MENKAIKMAVSAKRTALAVPVAAAFAFAAASTCSYFIDADLDLSLSGAMAVRVQRDQRNGNRNQQTQFQSQAPGELSGLVSAMEAAAKSFRGALTTFSSAAGEAVDGFVDGNSESLKTVLDDIELQMSTIDADIQRDV